MATASEGGGGGGRERKTNSSSNSQLRKPSLIPSSSQPSPPSSQKPLPNYLRPTISSSQATQPGIDFFPKSFRRSSSTSSSANIKPSPDKRRSYDKPPSPALVQRAATNTREHKTTRPTSSSGSKTAPSVKPAPLRSVSSLTSRSTRAPALSTKRGSLANNSLNKVASKDGPRTRSVTSESSLDFEGRDEDIMGHVMGETRCESDQYEAQSLQEISEISDQEEKLGDPDTVVVVTATVEARTEKYGSSQGSSMVVAEEVVQDQETAGKEDDQPSEPLVVEEKIRTDMSNEVIAEEAYPANHGKGVEENSVEVDSPKVEEKHVVVEQEAEGSKEVEETSVAAVQLKIENPVEVKAYEHFTEAKEDVTPSDAKVDVSLPEANASESPAEARAEVSPLEAKAFESSTEAKADLSPAEAKANESPAKAKADESPAKAKADKSPATAKADKSPATAKAESPAKKTQPGKKGTPVNNDAITEAASKLMERKNRVRALAGAFETVMQK